MTNNTSDNTSATEPTIPDQLALWERRRKPRWSNTERERNLARVRQLRRRLAEAEEAA